MVEPIQSICDDFFGIVLLILEMQWVLDTTGRPQMNSRNGTWETHLVRFQNFKLIRDFGGHESMYSEYMV